MTSFISDFAPLVKNCFFLKTEPEALGFLLHNEKVCLVFSSMENNNFFSAAFCQDSRVAHSGVHRFWIKKAAGNSAGSARRFWPSLFSSAGGKGRRVARSRELLDQNQIPVFLRWERICRVNGPRGHIPAATTGAVGACVENPQPDGSAAAGTKADVATETSCPLAAGHTACVEPSP